MYLIYYDVMYTPINHRHHSLSPVTKMELEPTPMPLLRLEELRKRMPARAPRERMCVPALARRLVVGVIAVVETLTEFCVCAGKVSRGRGKGRKKCGVPGLFKTSYASLTAAIFASLPPLSGWAVIAAFRL